MDLSDVMQEVSDRLDTITGLRCYAQPTSPIAPPCSIVGYPTELGYDETYARGADKMTLPITLVVGQANQRSARVALGEYANGSGAKSIKTVLESGTYTEFHSITVTDAAFDVVDIGGVAYVAAVFHSDIVGHGS